MGQLPNFNSYGKYANSNEGKNTMCLTDAKGNDFYYSYKTIVAFRTQKTGLVVCENVWSMTTGKHLNWINPNHKTRLPYNEFKKLFEETFKKPYQG